jgi:hypothetical protein
LAFNGYFDSNTIVACQTQKSLGVSTGRNSWASLGAIKSVAVTELACTATNMSFFDKVQELQGPLYSKSYHISTKGDIIPIL